MSLRLVEASHEALWTPARNVPLDEISMHAGTLKLMQEAVAKVGAAGMAAPQIGLSLRMFVTNAQSELPPVAINPEWKPVGHEFISKPERCLSQLSYSTYVRRPAKCYAQWLDADGHRKTALLEGMDARVFLHLFDLIEGRPIFPRPKAPVPV